MEIQFEEIMKEACEGHTAVLDANNRSKSGALESGEALLRAKTLVPHGEWDECLKKHFNASNRTAQRYMRVARDVANGTIDPDDYETLFHMEQAVASKRISGSEAQSPDLDEGEDDFDFDDDEEDDEPEQTQENEPESASSKKSASKEPAPSKKKDVDPLRDAMKAIGRALGAADDEKRIAWAQILRDEIDLYMESLDQEEAA